MKTLTDTGINKVLTRLQNSLAHATYLLDGAQQQTPIFKTAISDSTIRIYIYLDETVAGTVAQISLVDTDGDVIATAARQFVKPSTSGLYSVFAYTLTEEEMS
jgi:hypothetical protein